MSKLSPGRRSFSKGRRLKGFGASERGSVAIEFAAVAIIFLTILFGLITYGFQFATRIALSYAAAEGSRAALGGLSENERISLATNAAEAVLRAYAPLIDEDAATISVTTVSSDATGRTMEISLTYNDSRFSNYPFVPSPGAIPVVSSRFYVSDPS